MVSRKICKMNSRVFYIIAVALNTLTVFGEATPKQHFRAEVEDPGYYRLPKGITPTTYDIRLIPFIQDGNFSGAILITVQAAMATRNITLHSKELNITPVSVSLIEIPSKTFSILKTTEDKIRDFFTIVLNDTLDVGKMYTIEMKFEGKLRDTQDGFYRWSYKDENGTTQWMAATQFKPNSARKAFPCFDEPQLKASFFMTIARPKNMKTFSNEDIVVSSSKPDLPPDYVWDIYKGTKDMSTYVLGFSVSNFSVGNYYRMNLIARGMNTLYGMKFGLIQSSFILAALEMFTLSRYPFIFIKMLAIPDSEAGAQENLDFITFRESTLELDSRWNDVEDIMKMEFAYAQQFSYQWFSSLVTPEWWTYVWLSDGFATYMQYQVLGELYHDATYMGRFLVEQVQRAFLFDATEWSHPMTVNLQRPEDMIKLSDDITSGKAAAVIRMMDSFIGRDHFQFGVHSYLSTRIYNTANEDILFDSFNFTSPDYSQKTSLKVIMGSWTNQTGYPVITVQRNYESEQVTITQERYLSDNSSSANRNQQWWIPLFYTTQALLNFEDLRNPIWINSRKITTSQGLISAKKSEWIIFNVRRTGFYRVNYDKNNWKLITKHLHSSNFEDIHAYNRAQLIDDCLNLAKGGYLDYSVALDLVSYMAHEREFLPWYAALEELEFLDIHLSNPRDYLLFTVFVRNLLKEYYSDIRTDENRNLTGFNAMEQYHILPWACKYDCGDCVQTAVKYFQNWTTSSVNTIPVNMRYTVYCYGVLKGGKEAWKNLFIKLNVTTAPSEKERLIKGLGCINDTETLKTYLTYAIDNISYLGKENCQKVFESVFDRKVGVGVVVDFLITNYNRTINACGNKVIRGLATRISTGVEANKMKIFLKNLLPNNDIEIAIKIIDQNLGWVEKYGPVVRKWLANSSSGLQGVTSLFIFTTLLLHYFL